jgi:excisionase family DNA binding protein
MLTVKQVAERLNVSAATVYNLVVGGKLACHKIGVRRGTVRVSESQLADYLAATEQKKQRGAKPQKPAPVKLKHLSV